MKKVQKLFVKRFMGTKKYVIIKTLNLTDFLKAAEIGRVLTSDDLRAFVLYNEWEVEIS